MTGIGVLMKEIPENSLALPAMSRPSREEQKMALYEPGSHQTRNLPVPILDVPASGTIRNVCRSIHPVSSVFVTAA